MPTPTIRRTTALPGILPRWTAGRRLRPTSEPMLPPPPPRRCRQRRMCRSSRLGNSRCRRPRNRSPPAAAHPWFPPVRTPRPPGLGHPSCRRKRRSEIPVTHRSSRPRNKRRSRRRMSCPPLPDNPRKKRTTHRKQTAARTLPPWSMIRRVAARRWSPPPQSWMMTRWRPSCR